MQYVIGVDVGSGSVRAGIFSITGDSLIFKSKDIKNRKMSGNFVEQSSTDIWESLCYVVKESIKEAKINPLDIIAIGFDATCSLVVLDKDDKPVSVNPDNDDYWNIIMWMDHRAEKETELINSNNYEVLNYVGGKISIEMEIPKILWLKNNLIDSYKRIDKFFDLADFLQYKASGSDIRSSCTLACKWTYLAHENRWDKSFFEAIGLSDLLENKNIGTTVKEPGSLAGTLTKQSALELGLHENVKVSVGMIDAHAGGLGSLRDEADDVLVIVAGTSACHMMNRNESTFIPGIWGPYYNAMVSNMWLNEGGQSAYGSLLDYTLRNHSYYSTVLKQVNGVHNKVYDVLNDEIKRLREKDPYIIKDLHVLDYHYGNRSPRADNKPRGMIVGIDMAENLESMAKIYLAVLDSICFGTRHIIEVARDNGYKINTIIVCGGATKNTLYMQELADICNQDIYFAGHDEAVVLGSAINAAIASGEYPTYKEALNKMGRLGDIVKPNNKLADYYNKKYEIYLNMFNDKIKYENIMKDF
ncbi:FGGY carbohydrate kinase domain-containing protein [Brachyspira suanatina]|uniref:FGGY carbohydrate kinase domain-containing protein n=1 Tax=Brachyspira suanatina TaxID=381802 RepID=A0A0G4K949_9SPIR|nr:FGGY-family carbohydrate kinase [Brachyspira suanatina]CRF34613.1 FGGY carbohydrate kinase domain-containing protein [Brachyspira suanatina]